VSYQQNITVGFGALFWRTLFLRLTFNYLTKYAPQNGRHTIFVLWGNGLVEKQRQCRLNLCVHH